MKSDGIRVLILEDDALLGDVLREGLQREGHDVVLVGKPDEALEQVQSFKPDIVLVDCLLPQMSGVEFLEKINAARSTPIKSILMSGIYTDRLFVQESLQKTRASGFLKKPFDLQELSKLLKKEKDEDKGAGSLASKNLYQIFTKEMNSTKNKKQIIETLDSLTGFDLPHVYHLISETKLSGYLNLYYEDNTTAAIGFSAGAMVSLQIEDKATFLGEMLIQNGFIKSEDLRPILESKSPKKLGLRLVHGNLLSPHALDLVMLEQMNIRLSRTINSRPLKCSFASSDVEYVTPAITSEQISMYLHDWIASKISVGWLKSLYKYWMHRPLTLAANFKPDSPYIKFSLFKGLEGLYEHLQRGTTLASLLDSKKNSYAEAAIYKGLHFLLLKGLLHLSTQAEFLNAQEQRSYLENFLAQVKGKKSGEILDLLGINMDLSLEQQKEKILAGFGSDPGSKDKDLQKLWLECRNEVGRILKGSGDFKERKKIKESQDKASAENVLRANQLIEEVKKHLHFNQTPQAKAKLEEALRLNEEIHQAHLYGAWIKIIQMESGKSSAVLRDVSLELTQVAPDEKYDALYPTVMGLFHKASGDLQSAKKSFEKALGIDPGFLVARRELGLLAQALQPKPDIFTRDLKDVVTGFFKKTQ